MPPPNQANHAGRINDADGQLHEGLVRIVSQRLGYPVRLERFDTDDNGWPMPVFLIPEAYAAAASALGLSFIVE